MKLLDIYTKLSAILVNTIGDKAAHAATGFLIGLVLSAYPSLALMAVLIAAVGKELWDAVHQDTNDPDTYDAISTVIGGCTGIVLGQVIITIVRAAL